MLNNVATKINDFLQKTGLSGAYIARQTGINRTSLNLYLRDSGTLSYSQEKKLLGFISDYKQMVQAL
jgi:transcriptional regulator with XRE-family HTH domain